MPGSISPKPWTPSKTPLPLANISAGEWVQVEISYRRTNTSAVVFADDHFLIHVLFQPNSDDSVNHPDQPTTFGGSATLGSAARNVYRIDPGICFQAPWNGQLSVVAGGNSDPNTCIVDVVWRRGFPPRMPSRNNIGLFDNLEDIEALACSNPLAAYSLMMDGLANLCDVGGTIRPMGERIWWPPVLRTPYLVPATWIQIAAPIGPAPVPSIPFPPGAQSIEVVSNTGVPADPVRLLVSTLGNPALDVRCASGILRTIAHFTQGGVGPDGVAALWAPYLALDSATVWSTLGN